MNSSTPAGYERVGEAIVPTIEFQRQQAIYERIDVTQSTIVCNTLEDQFFLNCQRHREKWIG